MAKLKTYAWIAMRPDLHSRNGHSQVRMIVAAPSGTAAARIVGKQPRQLFNFGETWNDAETAAALAEPGRVFWTELNGHTSPRPDPTQEWGDDDAPRDANAEVVARVEGTITLADGSTSKFAITDGSLQQWGAPTRRLGLTVDLLEAMAACIVEEG